MRSAYPSVVVLAMLIMGCKTDLITSLDGLTVPDGFSIESAVLPSLLSYPTFASFDDAGNLFVCESTATNNMGTDSMIENPSYHIRLLKDTDDDGVFDQSTIFADRLAFPMGGEFYQGSFYTAVSPDLLKLTDTEGDGIADEREVILTGWTLNSNGAILSGPFMGPDGFFYLADARRGFDILTREEKRLQGRGARIWRCLPDGTKLEWICGGGFDNAVEIIFTPSGETMGTMTYFTDPRDGERDALMHWIEGGIYPKPHPTIAEDKLPRTGPLMPVMTKLARIAPSGLMRYEGSNWGPEYQGNLFSAEFNTGRIMRFEVSRHGATFQTNGSSFVNASSSDIHVTDVLQDADGSMLVVITGGWFIAGCPLSRVAKPDVRGGIYRIRKKDQERVRDAWGRGLSFEDMPAGQLAKFLDDERPNVRKKALAMLSSKGDAAIDILTQALAETDDEEKKCAWLFALSRMDVDTAHPVVRKALTDGSVAVRIAAARISGLKRDGHSVEALSAMVLSDVAAVQRQAATALGQIGSAQAVDALLQAIDQGGERILEHTLVFALMQIGDRQSLMAALDSHSGAVRKAAMIALDQMMHQTLSQEVLLPFLTSSDTSDQQVAVWIAAQHPEWSAGIVDHIQKQINTTGPSILERKGMQSLMHTFSAHAAIEDIVAEQLVSPEVSREALFFLLETVKVSAHKVVPERWVQALAVLLKNQDARIRSQVLQVVEARSVPGLERILTALTEDPTLALPERLRALGAKLMIAENATAAEFALIMKILSSDPNPMAQHQAVALLSRMAISDAQLLAVAKELIPQADAFLLPNLMDAFKGSTADAVGSALIESLERADDRLEHIAVEDLHKLFENFGTEVSAKAAPLIASVQQRQFERLARLEDIERQLEKGDVGRGRSLFFGKATCSTCHAVGSRGSDFGPDLSNIGEIRSRHDLLEAIIYPSSSFAREYETYQLQTQQGVVHRGVIKEQTATQIVLSIGPGVDIRIGRDDVSSIGVDALSLMPPGMDQLLSSAELADLLSFLEALPYRIDRLLKLSADRESQ